MTVKDIFLAFFKARAKEESNSRVVVVKGDNDDWYFLGVYSNKFIDRDKEILSEASHKEYAEWLNQSGFKPVITAYHLPRAKDPMFWTKMFVAFEDNIPVLQKIVDVFYKPLAFAKAERVVYLNGFSVVIAKFLKGKEDVAERLSKMKDVGMSHGFINKESSDNIFTKYRTFEMSILRNVRAANLFTLSNILRGNLGMPNKKSEEKQLSAEDRAFMVSTFGEDVTAILEKDTEKMQQILSASLEFKDSEAKADMMMPEDEDEDEEDEKEDEKQVSESGLTVESVAKATKETFEGLHQVITEMQQKMVEYEAKIAELESKNKETAETVEQIKQDDDRKISEHWLPQLDWRSGYSASQAKDNLVKNKKEKEELTEDAPKGTQAQPASSVMQFALAPLFQKGLGG